MDGIYPMNMFQTSSSYNSRKAETVQFTMEEDQPSNTTEAQKKKKKKKKKWK